MISRIIILDEKEMFVQFGQTPVRSNQTLPLQVAQQPFTVSFQGDPNRLYTLLFYDLSAPQGPYMHYQISNIEGGDISKGNTIFKYQPPNPPPQSGVHTYVVEINEQGRPLPKELNEGGRAPVPLESLREIAELTPVSQIPFQVVAPGSFAGPTTRSRAALIAGYNCGCGHKPRPVQVETVGYNCGCGRRPQPITSGSANGYALGDASGTGGQYSIMPTGFFGVASSENDYPSYIIREAGTGQAEGVREADLRLRKVTPAQLQAFNRGDVLIGEGTQYNWAGSSSLGFPRATSSHGSSTPLELPRGMISNGLNLDYSGKGSGFFDENTGYPGLSTGILGMGNSNGVAPAPLSDDWFLPDAPLTDADRSYCRCTIEVAGGQPIECNTGQVRPRERSSSGQRCVNPYAVCHSSVQGERGFPDCTRYFDFSKIPDRELYGYATSHKLPFPIPALEQYNRAALIEQLEAWRAQKQANLAALGLHPF